MTVARNDVTGDKIQTKGVSDSYRDNYDKIFGNKKAQTRPLRVAVYGTLKEGRGNHRCMISAGGTKLGVDTVPATLYKYCGAFPAVSLEPRQQVVVEVYDVEDMCILDGLEGYPNFYNRSVISTKYGDAWIYHMKDEDLRDTVPIIESGEF